MNDVLLKYVSQNNLKARPQVKTGMRVKVTQKIKEGDKERSQSFEGLVIKTNKKKGINHTFTVRTVIGGIGVEKVFPLHGENIEEIKILKQNKVRRAKLYYMRDRSGKSARLKEVKTDINKLNELIEPEMIELKPKKADKVEEPKAESTEAKAEETTEKEAA
jgi:large subunit ribosomal protein L19